MMLDPARRADDIDDIDVAPAVEDAGRHSPHVGDAIETVQGGIDVVAAAIEENSSDQAAIIVLALRVARLLPGVDDATIYYWDREAEILCSVVVGPAAGLTALVILRPGQGASGQAFIRNAAVVVDQYATWDYAEPRAREAAVGSAMAVPIATNSRLCGVLVVESGAEAQATPWHVQSLMALAALLGPSVEAHIPGSIAERRRLESRALHDIMRLGADDLPDGIFAEIARRTAAVMAADYVVIKLETRPDAHRLLGSWGQATRAMKQEGDDREASRTVSLISRNVRVGALHVGWRTPIHLSADHTELLEAIGGYTASLAHLSTRADEPRRDNGTEASLDIVVEQLPCGVLILNGEGIVTDANEAAEGILGRSPLGLRGDDVCRDAGPSIERIPSTKSPIRIALRTRVPQREVVLGIVRPDGLRRWIQLDAMPINRPDGDVEQVIVSLLDITAQLQATEALTHQTVHDALTGLPNRTLLYDRLQQAVLSTERTHGMAALLLLDLDRFKDVNDTLGHHYGDKVLQQVAERLRLSLRASDTVARLGGDEFAVLLPGDDRVGASQAARKIQTAIEAPILVDGHALRVSASVGITLYPEHGIDPQTLLRRADVAMYLAKGSASRRAVYTLSQDEHSPERLALADALRHAIANEHLVVHYQPKVNVVNGDIDCVEALVRWQHPIYGLMAPDQFIPLAEQTGLIGLLTRWVMGTALRQCTLWREAGTNLCVAINLSASNLRDPRLTETIVHLLERHKVDPSNLRVELTESTIMTDTKRALKNLERLAARGIRISIDDFGTGYSSLSYLKKLPVAELKIDKSFVQHMAQDPTDAAIVNSTIGLAHSLGLRVVAEGVETNQAWDLLASMLCDSAQGYYVSRPLPADELQRWVNAGPWSLA